MVNARNQVSGYVTAGNQLMPYQPYREEDGETYVTGNRAVNI